MSSKFPSIASAKTNHTKKRRQYCQTIRRASSHHQAPRRFRRELRPGRVVPARGSVQWARKNAAAQELCCCSENPKLKVANKALLSSPSKLPPTACRRWPQDKIRAPTCRRRSKRCHQWASIPSFEFSLSQICADLLPKFADPFLYEMDTTKAPRRSE